MEKTESIGNGKRRIEEIDYAFGSMNNLVSDDLRLILDKALTKMPSKIVDWATTNVLFLSSNNYSDSFSLNPKDWKHVQGLIVLCEKLKTMTKKEQAFVIAHELAHVKLGHRSPILSKLYQDKFDFQEKEADSLARKWLESKGKRE